MTISADRALGDLDTVLRLREAPDLVAFSVFCETVDEKTRDRVKIALRALEGAPYCEHSDDMPL